MAILIYPIKSILTNNELINGESIKLLDDLKKFNQSLDFQIIDSLDNLSNQLVLILIQSGGSENYFKEKIFSKFPGPYYLLTYGVSNSLAAAMEILAFIKSQDKQGEILHGDVAYIVSRIVALENNQTHAKTRLGVIGKPSDWLIASNVNYHKCLDTFNLELVDIKDDELIDLIKVEEDVSSDVLLENLTFDKSELNKALKIEKALRKIIAKYQLAGLTIRCFDMISKVKSTACIALAKLNDEGITAICEGDIPIMITAHLINQKLHTFFFQANPQFINPTENTIEFAHCTIPFKMCKHYELTTHFESGIGVAVKGTLENKVITIIRIDPTLNYFYLSLGTIIPSKYSPNRCRTQIKIKLENDVSYFLKHPLANHHIIIYGDYVSELKRYFKNLGLIQII